MDALLSAAAQPGTEEELAGMSAFVQVFTAEVTASTLTFRSHSMLAGRITRRATAMIAITLLAAGGAAAAAAGVDLPSPFSSAVTAEVLSNSDTTDDNSIVDTTDVDSSNLISLDGDSDSPELHDLCEAWAKDANQDANAPAFADLAAAAEQATQSIDDFCAAVSNDDDDSDDSDDDNSTDNSSDDSDDDSDDDDSTDNSTDDDSTDNSSDNSIDDDSTDNSTDNSTDDDSGSNSNGGGGSNSGSDKTDAPTTAKPVKGENNG